MNDYFFDTYKCELVNEKNDTGTKQKVASARIFLFVKLGPLSIFSKFGDF